MDEKPQRESQPLLNESVSEQSSEAASHIVEAIVEKETQEEKLEENVDEQDPGVVIENNSCETDDEPRSSSGTKQPESGKSIVTVSQEVLANSRSEFLSLLLSERRLSAAEIDKNSVVHAETVSAAYANLTVECEMVRAKFIAKDLVSRQNELSTIDSIRARLSSLVQAIDQLYSELSLLVSAVSEGIEKRRDDMLDVVPDQIRENLITYRQGLTIIHRMLCRAIERKTSLVVGDFVLAEVGTDVNEVSDTSAFCSVINQLYNDYHNVRDTNYHLIHDAKAAVETQLSKVKGYIKQFLAVVDGIDSGVHNEKENKAAAGNLLELDEKTTQVISFWYGAYDSLSVAVDHVISKTDLEQLDVIKGMSFDPETMEPQGVVQRADMKNDDVAVVLRRGFSFCGQMIRPALVEVVKNS